MKFFSIYFKKRLPVFILFSVFSIVFAVVFSLFNLPLMPVAYSFEICSVIGFIFILSDYSKHKSISDNIQILLKMENINSDDISRYMPPCPEKEIMRNICDELEKIKSLNQNKINDMVDYYTVWAHQIKTPVASMKLNLHNEDSNLSRILQSDLSRIDMYIEMVLTYMRLESDYTDYVINLYSLDEIIRESVKRFSGDFINKKIKLKYSPVNVFCHTDKKWMTFVIGQVISNSLKYTDSGSVKIYAENSKLFIEDTGIGINTEDLPRIFEKGYTGQNGRLDKASSGLGLYLCGRICKNLRHNISASSQPGCGTVISIDFSENERQFE